MSGSSSAARDLRDYALIGDCETAALVGRDGAIDWLCWPRFDSEACFARLLGDGRHGCWSLRPAEGLAHVRRRYLDGSLILETVFETASGAVAVTDFMPVRGAASDLVRIVEGRAGRVPMEMRLDLRFDYGRCRPWIQSATPNSLRAVAGPHAAELTADAELRPAEGGATARFAVAEGERRAFVLTYSPSHERARRPIDPHAALSATLDWWRDWISRCDYSGPYAEDVRRSLVVLKGLTYRPTGGMVAAPTTSLPEHPGGERNWDYRYCWLRDATFTLLTFMESGLFEEARAWRDWLVRAVAGEPGAVQPVYGVAGEQRLIEWIEPGLPGFNGAQPVRIGNAAFRQSQLDVFGEVLDALHQARRHGQAPQDPSWPLQRAFIDHLVERWREPDAGIWEVRGPPQHFTHSKVMAWVAFDVGVQAVEQQGLRGDAELWRTCREEVRQAILRDGLDPERGGFTRAFGSAEVDASLLLLPQVGFVAPDDPRMLATVEAIEQDLSWNGLIRRYDTATNDDGLPPGEGAFLACSFWLVDAYTMQGRREEAEALFERLLSFTNDVGLLPEEVDPRTGAFLGNFPQGLSHLSLVDAAYNLSRTRGPAEERRTRD
ncbi:MAG: glycoside hydrolase family 15 protein [Pseudomonadota bacterium]